MGKAIAYPASSGLVRLLRHHGGSRLAMSVVVEIVPLDVVPQAPHLAATVVQDEVVETTRLERTINVIVIMIEEIEIVTVLEVLTIEIGR